MAQGASISRSLRSGLGSLREATILTWRLRHRYISGFQGGRDAGQEEGGTESIIRFVLLRFRPLPFFSTVKGQLRKHVGSFAKPGHMAPGLSLIHISEPTRQA